MNRICSSSSSGRRNRSKSGAGIRRLFSSFSVTMKIGVSSDGLSEIQINCWIFYLQSDLSNGVLAACNSCGVPHGSMLAPLIFTHNNVQWLLPSPQPWWSISTLNLQFTPNYYSFNYNSDERYHSCVCGWQRPSNTFNIWCFNPRTSGLGITSKYLMRYIAASQIINNY